MAARNSPARAAQPADLVLTRVFDAPRELVFRAWTEPEHLKHWWGPALFTVPRCTVDLRPGGEIDLVMRGQDGVDYPMWGQFLEVVPPERLAMLTGVRCADGSWFFRIEQTVTFAAQGPRTVVTLTARILERKPEADPALAGMAEGWAMSLQRMAAYGAGLAAAPGAPEGGYTLVADPGQRAFVVTRYFDAPPERVYAAWTQPESMAQWYGPRGSTLVRCEIDLRVGGGYRYVLRTADGRETAIFGTYKELVPPSRMLLTEGWQGAPPGVEAWVAATMEPRGAGTQLTVEVMHTTVAGRDLHLQGGSAGMRETLQRLAGHLAARR